MTSFVIKSNETEFRTGVIEISGRQYVTSHCLATMLGVTARTLARWDRAGIGPPKIKIGKRVLYDLAKLPDWLTTRETAPVATTRSLERD
jgi:hypothetical protein